MKKILFFLLILAGLGAVAQDTFPVNGSWDKRPGLYAFTNANIVVNAEQTISNGTLLVKDRIIESVGQNVVIPKGYITIDLKGKYIYPSLVDAFTTYGVTASASAAGRQRGQNFTSSKPGAYYWNESIRPETSVKASFTADAGKAEEYKKNGFGAVQSISRDGIARGTSVVATLGDENEHEVILKDQAAANYSFSKGSSTNNYPSSLMGSIALLRQAYNDAAWYKTQKEEYNISLEQFNQIQNLPQIFEVSDALSVLRADKIGDEFGKQYIFKTDGKEYQRINAIKATGGSFIVPLTFPKAYDVEDPADARNLSLTQLKDWELAPGNLAALEKAGIRFAITASGLESSRDFWSNLRTAIERGLSEKQALRSLTTIPAEMLGVSSQVGSLNAGKLANFIITSDRLFKKDNVIYENWVKGRQYVVAKMAIDDLRGTYALKIDGLGELSLKLGGTASAYDAQIERVADSTKVKANLSRNGDVLSINFDLKTNPAGTIRMSGYIASLSPLSFKGEMVNPDGTAGKWTAIFKEAFKEAEAAKETPKAPESYGEVTYPFTAYGNSEAPKAESILFKNATVWTNEKEGRLSNTDVWIENGKIKAVGKDLKAPNAKIIDATGKHISPGIIDEHSHIAGYGGINEGAQSVSAEVRIGDIITSEDINIYRQLAGGVTTSHILHGSANAIGGQTQIIKLRWGKTPEEMKFEGADGFIKFALGENVKQSNWQLPGGNTRFPQSRMGVEQVYVDAFTRAKEYQAARLKGKNVRRDLELDALVEILNNKRFITCHSYVQSEINMLMHVADSMGFRINTFTHILEGYKVADKMAQRGIAGSTFSDWWSYKSEVLEAIPYNGKLMHQVGVLTGFNSDDAEMARRLNQEAAKAITYGGMDEEDALKLVTLNPAKMLHIDNRVGSIKAGKDADLVLWSANPLSIYAVAEKTFVDGIAYWDIDQDAAKQKALIAEEARIIQKMIDSKNGGSTTQKPAKQRQRLYECETLEEDQFVNTNRYQ